jgi:hypothetical protein
MGTAAVNSEGTVRVCMNQNATVGNSVDTVSVKVTDKNDTKRTLTAKVQISVGTNEPRSGECDVNAFGSGDEGGGCCDAGQRSTGAIPLALGLLLILRRRRR